MSGGHSAKRKSREERDSVGQDRVGWRPVTGRGQSSEEVISGTTGYAGDALRPFSLHALVCRKQLKRKSPMNTKKTCNPIVLSLICVGTVLLRSRLWSLATIYSILPL